MGVKLIECIFRRQGSLGLTLVESSSHIIIKDFEGQAKELKSIKKGDRIVKIGNRDVQRCTLKDILGILRKSMFLMETRENSMKNSVFLKVQYKLKPK